MARLRQRKETHTRGILKKKTFHIGSLLPGMIVQFAYNAPDTWDRRPLLFYLGEGTYQVEGQGRVKEGKQRKVIPKTVSGINLNYLEWNDLQEMFKGALKMFEGRFEEAFVDEEFFNLGGEFTRIGFTNKLHPSDVDVREFLDRYVKQKMFPFEKTKHCYRTYKMNYVSAIKIVDFKINVWEKYQNKRPDFIKEYVQLGGKLTRSGNPDLRTRQGRVFYERIKRQFGI